ncbi:LysE family translocator [Aquitalea magnusonii]|uniref:LysE family translocator n=1 Tax=Aquitalea magnusonii TaxID=332411 RepID=UPI000A9CAAF2|nr:LysE family transporter [Aquitalea magnusonii]
MAGDAARLQAARPGKILREAFFTNLFNPKVALFFLAFLPQFVKPGATAVSFVILGLTFVATGLLWCAALALLSARLGEWLRRKGVAQRLDQLCGGRFVVPELLQKDATAVKLAAEVKRCMSIRMPGPRQSGHSVPGGFQWSEWPCLPLSAHRGGVRPTTGSG